MNKKLRMKFLRSEAHTCALCPEWKPKNQKRKPPKPEPVTQVALVDVRGPETPENFQALCLPCFRLLESERRKRAL